MRNPATRVQFVTRFVPALLFGLLLTACGSSNADPTSTVQPAAPSATIAEQAAPTPTRSEEPTVTIPDDPDLYPQPVMLAIDAAANESGVPEEDVRVLSYTEREWPSTALGCPQPGFSYAQVVTPGFHVQLLADGTTYEYHTNLTTSVILCSAS